jgi:cyclohexanone monooxygenase
MPYSGGVRGYRRILHQCAQDGYSGFTLRGTPAASGGLNRTPQVSAA